MLQLDYPGQFDDEIKQESDGSFTVTLSPWCDEPINNIPTRELAEQICCAAYRAMRDFGASCMTED